MRKADRIWLGGLLLTAYSAPVILIVAGTLWSALCPVHICTASDIYDGYHSLLVVHPANDPVGTAPSA
jgi:hypothetical protein